jgi:enoyl-CoA hydratase/carnithine racemase
VISVGAQTPILIAFTSWRLRHLQISTTPATPPALNAEVRRFTDLFVAHSAATIALGKRTFYRQIGESLEAAYGVASEAMACNMGYEDTAAGIDAFLGRRRAD